MADKYNLLLGSVSSEPTEWMLPYWWERQTNPTSPSFTPASGAIPSNVTHRNVTPVGTLRSPEVATVDQRGLVSPWENSWSLDWWAGADDRWRIPARESGVRQAILERAPITVTTMRVPGGDLVQRVWAFQDGDQGATLVVEIDNASKAPLAIALALRPFGILGHQPVSDIEIQSDRVVVDGRIAMWLPKLAPRTAVSNFDQGDVARVVMTGAANESATAKVHCPQGFAQAALIYPLAHSATIQLLIPLWNVPATQNQERPTAVPPPDAVARGWSSHTRRALRVSLPDQPLTNAFVSAQAQVLLASGGRNLSEGDSKETAAIVRALDISGFYDEAAMIVDTLAQGQNQGGELGGEDPSPAATGAALQAATHYFNHTANEDLVPVDVGLLAAGAHYRPGSGRIMRWGYEPFAGVDAAWHLRGALDVAEVLKSSEQIEAAQELHRKVADLHGAIDEYFTPANMAKHSTDPLAALDAVVPLGVVDASGEAADELVKRIKARFVHEDAVMSFQAPAGLDTERTARLAQVELRREDRDALARITWLTNNAGSTGVWPGKINPRTKGGSGGSGWSVATAAAFVELVADLLAYVNVESNQIVLCPVLYESWLGGNFELHDLNTALGVISYAIRWHGKRPALLWEFTPKEGVGPVTITAPGLDPSWQTTDHSGDTLLEVPPIALEAEQDEEPKEEIPEQTVGINLLGPR